jgi:hypothetical protein
MSNPLKSLPSPTNIREELEQVFLKEFLGSAGGPEEEISANRHRLLGYDGSVIGRVE